MAQQQTSQLKTDVDGLNNLIKEGKIMEAFEKYYADEVVIHENGSAPVKGKEENRKRGINFLWEIEEVYNADVMSVALDHHVTMTEWAIDVKTNSGVRKIIYRVNVQAWKDGKITNERLYFCKD